MVYLKKTIQTGKPSGTFLRTARVTVSHSIWFHVVLFSYFAARWHLIGDCTKNLLVFLTSQIIFSMFQINFIRVWHANDSALYYLALDTTILVFVNNLGMLKKKSSYMPWIFFISLIIRFVIESSVCLWRWLDWRKDHPNEKLINISIKILENMGKLLVWII